jgi:hypothetical protein
MSRVRTYPTGLKTLAGSTGSQISPLREKRRKTGSARAPPVVWFRR